MTDRRWQRSRSGWLGWGAGLGALLLAALLAVGALLEATVPERRPASAGEAGAPAPDLAARPSLPAGPEPVPAAELPPRDAGAPPPEAIEPLESALGVPPAEPVPYRSSQAEAPPPPAPLPQPEGGSALPAGPADKRASPGMQPEGIGALPPWKGNAVAVPPADGRPRIAVVLDDLGPAWRNSLRAAELPAPLTLALLPYAEGLPELAGRARAAGHELLVHMPMEPLDLAHNNPGPDALLTGLTTEELQRRLEANLGAFEGYVGINNHMGSAFSTDSAGLALVMAELKARGLLFLDSRTVGGTLAESQALAVGVPALGRDVFLDNSPDDPAAIWEQLRLTEQIARKRGFAVAIGHPHPATLEALAAWLPELEGRGFQLVPVSALAVEPGATAGLFARARTAAE